MFDYQMAMKNADKVADGIFNLHIRQVLDDGTNWVCLWEEDTDENPIAINKESGGIFLYNLEAHPEIKDAVPVKH